MALKKNTLVRIIVIPLIVLFIFAFFLKPFVAASDVGKRDINPNIIILLLDCVRADHLSCYGYTRTTSPNIDRLAVHGIKFNHVISQASWTFPSVFSLLSGYYPHKHGRWLINKKDTPLRRKFKSPSKTIPLLPALLQRAGYLTWAFSTNTYINEHRMQGRGFDEFTYIWKAPAMEVVNYGIEKIREAEKTGNHFFLYLHFMDSHHPLQPPEKYYDFFTAGDGEKNRRIHEGWEFERYADQQGSEFEDYRNHKISLYDGTIRYTDAEIGRLITELKSSGLMHTTLVILLADHGDEFWDHAELESLLYHKSPKARQGVSHGHTLFQELIRVPLIITIFHSQGEFSSVMWQSQEIEETVQLADLVPSILDLAGLPPVAKYDGISLLPLLHKRSSSFSSKTTRENVRSIFSESTPDSVKISLIEYPYKYIYAEKERDALFNLKEDPRERNNLINKEKLLASDMREKIIRHSKDKIPETEEVTFSKDDLEKLEALGYIDTDK